jgi:hypothetical protein
MRKLLLVALAASTTVAVAGVAGPAMAKPDPTGGCVVQQLDERGAVRTTWVEKQDAKRGEFRCAGGVWEYRWAPFKSDDVITAPALQVDPAGRISAHDYSRPGRGGDLTLGELANIGRVTTGADAVILSGAVVLADDGKKRTAAEIEAILAGKDTTGAKVLRVVDKIDPESTVGGVVDGTGGNGPVVVYFWGGLWDSITGAITGALNWIVDGLNQIGDWIDSHCVSGPVGVGGYGVVCTF